MDLFAHVAHDGARYGKIDHGMQPRTGVDDLRNHVDAHGDGADSAGNFRLVGHVDVGRSLDHHIVARIRTFKLWLHLLRMDLRLESFMCFSEL